MAVLGLAVLIFSSPVRHDEENVGNEEPISDSAMIQTTSHGFCERKEPTRFICGRRKNILCVTADPNRTTQLRDVRLNSDPELTERTYGLKVEPYGLKV